MLWHTCHISGHYNIYNISKYNSAIRELEVERLRKRHSDLQTICPQDHAGQGADLQKSPANKAVAWVMRQHVGSQMSGTVGPHVREGHGKTAYPTFTFILQYIYIKKNNPNTIKRLPSPCPSVPALMLWVFVGRLTTSCFSSERWKRLKPPPKYSNFLGSMARMPQNARCTSLLCSGKGMGLY